MKKRLFLVGLLAALMLPGCQSPEKEFEKDMEAFLAEIDAVGVSCAVVKDNQLIYHHNFGVKDRHEGAGRRRDPLPHRLHLQVIYGHRPAPAG